MPRLTRDPSPETHVLNPHTRVGFEITEARRPGPRRRCCSTRKALADVPILVVNG
jgi:hypothetical protein